MLHHLGDLFGPLNLKTLSEVRHFARTGFITDSKGDDVFVSQERLRTLWPRHGTLLLSARGSGGGMVDPHTTLVMADMLLQAGVPVERSLLEGGHQDSLIGMQAEKSFARVQAFLAQPRP